MMPTKERLAKERQCREEGKALGAPPNYLANVDMALNEDLQKNIGFYATNLVAFDENGEPYKKVPHPEKPSNDKRADGRRAEALRLKEKYPKKWGKRAYAKWIAGTEGVGIRTVQKYFKDFP